jgi:hypothetical protein
MVSFLPSAMVFLEGASGVVLPPLAVRFLNLVIILKVFMVDAITIVYLDFVYFKQLFSLYFPYLY